MFGFKPSPFFFGYKKRPFKPSAQLLAREAGAVFYMDARKISGVSPGSNDPVTVTVEDLSEYENNVTMSNFAGTASDGYVTYNDMPYIRTDGLDTYGSITTNTSLDITNEDFAFCWGGVVSVPGYIFAKGDNSSETIQYGIRAESNMSLGIYLNGYGAYYGTEADSIPTGTFARIEVIRTKGILKAYVNDRLVKLVYDNTTLVTQPNMRVFCRPNNSGYLNGYTAYLAVFKGEKVTDLGITNFSDKVSKDYITLVPNEYYVAPDGDDADPGTLAQPFLTIEKAIDTAVQCGDIVYLRGGTYRPSVDDYILFYNSGRAGRPITFKNYAEEVPVVDGSLNDWGWNWDALVYLNSQHYITIDGLTVKNSRWAGIADYSNYANQGSRGITVKNCIISDTQASGIAFYGCNDIVIYNNSIEKTNITNGSQESVSISMTDGASISYNSLFNITNAYEGGGGEGIDVKTGSKNVKVFGNILHDIVKHPLYIDAYDQETYNIEVYDNTIYNCPSGITIATEETGGNLHDVLIRNNTIYACTRGLIIAGWEAGSIRTMSDIVFKDNHVTTSEFAFFIGNPDASYITIEDNYLESGEEYPSMYVDPNETIDISTYIIDGNQITGVYAGHPTGTNYTIIGA